MKNKIVPIVLMVIIPVLGFSIMLFTRSQPQEPISYEDQIINDEFEIRRSNSGVDVIGVEELEEPDSDLGSTPEGDTLYINNAANEKLTLTVYSDFECPACAAFFYELRDGVKGYENDVDVIFVHYPLTNIHPHAEVAHHIAQAAHKQGLFIEVYTATFTYQDEWASQFVGGVNSAVAGQLLVERLEKNIAGLDVDQLKTDVESEAVAARVQQDVSKAAELGITSVPTLYLDDTILEVRTAEELQTTISLYLTLTELGN